MHVLWYIVATGYCACDFEENRTKVRGQSNSHKSFLQGVIYRYAICSFVVCMYQYQQQHSGVVGNRDRSHDTRNFYKVVTSSDFNLTQSQSLAIAIAS